ncbi:MULTISPECIES: hypothetical protein [unclassified Streptomyces]|uniref:hypothetical protein n=1 Tax=unclassified Streptomyces TaxID=2593676 RepID=UPI00225623B7|nr:MULTISPECIES: hypothetical protein [unclassified Streptomyces]MCX5058385.1 hypothetical protein [Streptomyces sp. NBC_00452]MCX5289533.1 hypothetical protein [Streptomyces sp. NBC_00183]
MSTDAQHASIPPRPPQPPPVGQGPADRQPQETTAPPPDTDPTLDSTAESTGVWSPWRGSEPFNAFAPRRPTPTPSPPRNEREAADEGWSPWSGRGSDGEPWPWGGGAADGGPTSRAGSNSDGVSPSRPITEADTAGPADDGDGDAGRPSRFDGEAELRSDAPADSSRRPSPAADPDGIPVGSPDTRPHFPNLRVPSARDAGPLPAPPPQASARFPDAPPATGRETRSDGAATTGRTADATPAQAAAGTTVRGADGTNPQATAGRTARGAAGTSAPGSVVPPRPSHRPTPPPRPTSAPAETAQETTRRLRPIRPETPPEVPARPAAPPAMPDTGRVPTSAHPLRRPGTAAPPVPESRPGFRSGSTGSAASARPDASAPSATAQGTPTPAPTDPVRHADSAAPPMPGARPASAPADPGHGPGSATPPRSESGSAATAPLRRPGATAPSATSTRPDPAVPPMPTARPNSTPGPTLNPTDAPRPPGPGVGAGPDPALSWSAPMVPGGTLGVGRPVVSFAEPEGYDEHARPRPLARRVRPRTAAVAACLVLGVGLIGGAATGSWLVGDSGDGGARDTFASAGSLWHSVPVDRLFPPTVEGTGAGPGGADRTWTRVAVAPDSGCKDAFDPLLKKALAPAGCQRLLRATYTDATQSFVTTVGLLFTDADAASMDALAKRFQKEGLGSRTDLMPRPYAAKDTAAARFGTKQRASWTISVLTDAPVVVYAVSGWADGRSVDTPLSAEQAIQSGATSAPAQAGLGNEAQGLADRIERALRKDVTSPTEKPS